jgi:hypothetical protein
MTVVEQYTKELHDKFKYYATWLPGNKLKVGDVGKLNNRVFEYETNLKNLGIPFEVFTTENKTNLDYKSDGSVSIMPKIKGSAPAVGSLLSLEDSGLTILFKKEKSILFDAEGVTIHRINDLPPVKAEVLKRFKEKTWEKDWVIITEMAVADKATIMISSNSDVVIDLQAKGEVKAGELKLADVDAGFALMNTAGLVTNIVANSELTPLFKVVGIRTKLFGSAELESRGEVDESMIGEIDFK